MLLFLICALSLVSKAEPDDTLSYNSYRNKLVVYSDFGFKAAPFNLKYDYPNGLKTLHFKHNLKPLLGIGVAYKWFALRIGFGLPGQLKSVSKYGESDYFDAGFKFNIKKRTFWDLDIRIYRGYVIKDAYKWNDSLSADNPNLHRPNTNAASFSLNSWFFRSKDFNMKAVFGIAGDFKKSLGTWYYKSTLNIFGIGNDSTTIIPTELTDTSVTKTRVKYAYAIDIGFVPGYAYVHKYKNWQTSVFGGFGGVLQAKVFHADGIDRPYLGLAPRVDFRFITGYSKPNYFFWLTTDFDIKSIKFQNMRYTQNFYSVTLSGGYRFNKRSRKEKKK